MDQGVSVERESNKGIRIGMREGRKGRREVSIKWSIGCLVKRWSGRGNVNNK